MTLKHSVGELLSCAYSTIFFSNNSLLSFSLSSICVPPHLADAFGRFLLKVRKNADTHCMIQIDR